VRKLTFEETLFGMEEGASYTFYDSAISKGIRGRFGGYRIWLDDCVQIEFRKHYVWCFDIVANELCLGFKSGWYFTRDW
jgi:hypothetical protein